MDLYIIKNEHHEVMAVIAENPRNDLEKLSKALSTQAKRAKVFEVSDSSFQSGNALSTPIYYNTDSWDNPVPTQWKKVGWILHMILTP